MLQKAKLIVEVEEKHVEHEKTIKSSRVEIDKLSALLGDRYKSVIAKAFHIFDRDGSGSLDKTELRKVTNLIITTNQSTVGDFLLIRHVFRP